MLFEANLVAHTRQWALRCNNTGYGTGRRGEGCILMVFCSGRSMLATFPQRT